MLGVLSFAALAGVILIVILLRGYGDVGGYPKRNERVTRKPPTVTGKNLGTESAPKSAKPYAAVPPPRGTRQSSKNVTVGQTLARGKKDRSNGPLKQHRMVAFYGNPLSSRMGILGDYAPKQMIKRLKKESQVYSALDPSRPAVPTIELIASSAQQEPGPKGLYIHRTPKSVIETYSTLARKNRALLLVDIQPGRDSVMAEVRALMPFLKRPYVELAIDPEYHVHKGQVPGENPGHVDGSQIERTIRFLNALVQKHSIPDKVLMVHEFQPAMITHKGLIKPTSHVEVVINADDSGTPPGKSMEYGSLVGDDPIQYGGFKLFYKQDYPLLSPEQVLRQKPSPAVVDYQ